MKVSIIIINYNTFSLTSNCIESVIRNTQKVDYEIILVDNASTECKPSLFLEKFPSIKLVESKINGGFAVGNNLGISMATGSQILLLNSDTVLREDSVSIASAFLQSHPEAGVVSCRMTYPNGKIQYTARKFRSLSWELMDLFRFIPLLLPYKIRFPKMLGKYFKHDINIECDWVNGAFFLFPAKVLKQLPGSKLDERFFMYGEDHLWCAQLKEAGYKILFLSETSIIHINSGSTSIEKQLALRKVMMKHEFEIMKFRMGTGLYYHLLKAIFGAKEIVRNFIKLVYFKLSGKIIK